MTEPSPEVVVQENGRAGVVTLNRPRALNAVTLGMVRALESFYHRCAKNPHIYGIVISGEGKAFSAGGDIRALYEWARTEPEAAARYYAEEYQHNWTLECFRKPHVALIDGIVMGGGIHRVAGENYRFAMPETGIGFFPDIGGGWFLPRMPGHAGMYLGLTGKTVDRAAAYYLGAVTHCIAASDFDAVKAAMIEAEPIDTVLGALHRHPGGSDIETFRDPIAHIFSASSVEGNLPPVRGAARTLGRVGTRNAGRAVEAVPV